MDPDLDPEPDSGNVVLTLSCNSGSTKDDLSPVRLTSASLSTELSLTVSSPAFLKFTQHTEELVHLALKLSPDEGRSARLLLDQLRTKLPNKSLSPNEKKEAPYIDLKENLNTNAGEVSGPEVPAHLPVEPEQAKTNSVTCSMSANNLPVNQNDAMASIPSINSSTGSSGSSEDGLTNNVEVIVLKSTLDELVLQIKNVQDNPSKAMSENGKSNTQSNTSASGESRPVPSEKGMGREFETEADTAVLEDLLSVWKCKYCSEVFTDWIKFQNHKPSHKKENHCDQCDAVFTTKGNLNVHHRAAHTGEKPFICGKCSGRFSTSGNLRRHLLTHQGLKPYSCSVCSSRFTEKKSLLIHQRSHTKEKPYICSDCGQGFSQSSILNSHKLIHSNQKPFSCCKCGRTFRQKSQLRHHESRHAGLKNYSCPSSDCNAAFVVKADLDRHVRSHGGKKFACATCGTTFMRKYSLNKHVLTKHSNLNSENVIM